MSSLVPWVSPVRESPGLLFAVVSSSPFSVRSMTHPLMWGQLLLQEHYHQKADHRMLDTKAGCEGGDRSRTFVINLSCLHVMEHVSGLSSQVIMLIATLTEIESVRISSRFCLRNCCRVLANYVDLGHEHTSYQPPAYFTAWQLNFVHKLGTIFLVSGHVTHNISLGTRYLHSWPCICRDLLGN
jgi:hypothetical protein